MSGIGIAEQKTLHRALYSAGVSAAISLHKFIYDSSSSSSVCDGCGTSAAGSSASSVNACGGESSASPTPPPPEVTPLASLFIEDMEREGADWKGLFTQLGKFIELDEMILSGNTGEAGHSSLASTISASALGNMITNEVAAAALAAFASATYRCVLSEILEYGKQT